MKTSEHLIAAEAISLMQQAEQEATKRFSLLLRCLRQWYGKKNKAYPPVVFIVGNEDSGKSTLVSHANIAFFAHDLSLKPCPHTLKKNAKFNWWFHQHLIVCELPSVYFMQRTSAVEQAIWKTFVALLQRSVLAKQIKLLLCLSVEKFIDASEQYQQLSLFYQCAQTLCPQQMPTLAIFISKIDLILGFNEFYAEWSQQQAKKKQGIILPLKRQHLELYLSEQLELQLQMLQQDLLLAMQHESDLHARVLIHEFPAQWKQLHEAMQQLLRYVLELEQKYQRQTQNLMIYWGSGKQARGQVDLLQQRFSPLFQSVAMIASDYQTVSRPYFIRGFFADFLLDPKATVERPLTIMKRVILSSVLTLMLSGVTLLLWQIKKEVNQVTLIHNELLAYQMMANQIDNRSSIAAIVPPLNVLRQAEQSIPKLPKIWLPLLQHTSAEQLTYKTHQLYQQALNRFVLAKLHQSLEFVLTDVKPHNPNELYAALKCYLMLSEKQHRDVPAFFNLYQHYALGLNAQTERDKQDWLQHVQKLLAQDFAPQTVNTAAIQQARSLLAQLKKDQLLAILLENKAIEEHYALLNADPSIPYIYRLNVAPQKINQDIKQLSQTALIGDWVLGTYFNNASITDFIQAQQKNYQDQLIHVWLQELNANNSLEKLSEHLTHLVNTQHSILTVLANLDPMTPKAQYQKIMQDLLAVQQWLAQSSHDTDATQRRLFWAQQYFMQHNDKDALSKLKKDLTNLNTPLAYYLEQYRLRVINTLLTSVANDLNKEWRPIYLFYQQNIIGHFPFIALEGEQQLIPVVSVDSFQKFFSNNGLLEQFLNKVTPFIDLNSANWQLKAIDNCTLPFSADALLKLMHAHLIARSFYQEKTTYPQLTFQLRLSEIESSIHDLQLAINHDLLIDHMLSDENEPETHTIHWSLNDTTSAVQLTLHDIDKKVSQRQWFGPWAWFKVLTQSALQQDDDVKHYHFTLDLDGHAAKYELITEHALNPFVPEFLSSLQLQENLKETHS